MWGYQVPIIYRETGVNHKKTGDTLLYMWVNLPVKDCFTIEGSLEVKLLTI
jgi:hypothetical protein